MGKASESSPNHLEQG